MSIGTPGVQTLIANASKKGEPQSAEPHSGRPVKAPAARQRCCVQLRHIVDKLFGSEGAVAPGSTHNMVLDCYSRRAVAVT